MTVQMSDWLEVIIPLIVLGLLYWWGQARVNRMIRNDMPRKGEP